MYSLFSQIDGTVFPNAGGTDVEDIFNIVFAILGTIAVIVVIYSSIQLIISQGNSEKVATARRGVIYAIAGLIVIILAGVIISFVISYLES